MNIYFVEHINNDENNRKELLFVNYDYFDGNDLIVKILQEKYDIKVGDKFDGIWYSIIPLYYKEQEYKLMWHEDVGNYIYSEQQDQESIDIMRELIIVAMNEINKRIAKSRA